MIDPRDGHGSTSILVHATTVALGDEAVMLRAVSGGGKSDLALRFLTDSGRLSGTVGERKLVADDQTRLTRIDNQLIASAPAAIAGRMEVRGVGIVEMQARPTATLRLVVDLVAPTLVARLPDEDETAEFLGLRLPLRRLAPFETSAPVKLVLLLALVISANR